MCSACSGNYSGDYDDSGEYLANVESARASFKEIANSESGAVDEEEACPLRGASDSPYSVAGSGRESRRTRGDDWAVLVSADEIIEIRFLRAEVCGSGGEDAT
jgi:hypothetical protein